MKKLIFLMLFLSITATAQVKITATTDVVNAVVGSKPTNNEPAFNLLASVRISDPYSGFTISPSFERFAKIEYTKFGIGIGKTFVGKRFEYATIVEATQTIRYEKHIAYIGYGIVNYLDYKISNKLYLTLQAQALKRTDIDKVYNSSNNYRISAFAGITFKLE